MAKLGFLGLGLMGGPMASNLLKAGHEVALWSHTAGKAKKLAAEGKGTFCATPREVGAAADYIFACVGDSAMSENVMTGPDGIIQGAKPGSVVADCSTIGPTASRRISKTFGAKGVHYLDAPCTGSTGGAKGGTLTFMIGGSQDVFEKTREYFMIMGKNLYYCGSAGMGLHAKLSQNLLLCNVMQGFIEGVVLAAKAGIEPELLFQILDNSAAKTGLVGHKAPFIFKRDFTANFSLRWMRKDIGLMLETGRELGVPLPATALVHELFGASMAKGHADEDFCSAITLLEEWAGVQIKGKNT